VRTETARTFVNWMGCRLGDCREPAMETAVATVVETGGHPQASIIGHWQRTDVASAAFVNCSSSSVPAFDDTHLASVTHSHRAPLWLGTEGSQGGLAQFAHPASTFHRAGSQSHILIIRLALSAKLLGLLAMTEV
jgi:hypothetical protein